ncbi:MAG: hypothetical protein WC690_00225, partial [bacterium]
LRNGYLTQAAGSGVAIVALKPGVVGIKCKLDGTDMDEIYEVTVPPQSLIQILVAEASQQLAEEAVIDEDVGADVVALDSVSPTATALGSVIRRRIDLIDRDDKPELFGADPTDYNENPPASYYDAVIMAKDQFSPTNETDPTYETFVEASQRRLLTGEMLVAYDQAVITAAGIFNGDVLDNTGNAFAFLSPTQDQWNAIAQAFTVASLDIPANAGFTDASFPDLAPIQILIQPDVWKYDDGRPAFVFARIRLDNTFAVVNTP